MKSILIDELFKDSNTRTSATVSINGKDYTGYTIAKPLNYEKDHLLKINTRHFEDFKNQITQNLYWQKQLYRISLNIFAQN